MEYLTAVAILVTVMENRAVACECITSGPPCRAAWTADAVFAGTVVSIEQSVDNSGVHPRDASLVKFNVDRGFVNASAGIVVLASDFSSCSYSFKVGEKLPGIRIETGASLLTTSTCSRTRRLAEAQEDLKSLPTMNAAAGGGQLYRPHH